LNTPVDSHQSDKIWRANPVFWIMLALKKVLHLDLEVSQAL
jgi:hypothetical protein